VTEINQNSLVCFQNIAVFVYIQTETVNEIDFRCLKVTEEKV